MKALGVICTWCGVGGKEAAAVECLGFGWVLSLAGLGFRLCSCCPKRLQLRSHVPTLRSS